MESWRSSFERTVGCHSFEKKILVIPAKAGIALAVEVAFGFNVNGKIKSDPRLRGDDGMAKAPAMRARHSVI